MEQVRGLTPNQCQSPQYNAVKIDIYQPKVQTPKNNCCKGECPHSLYGQKGKNSATMPLPSNVVLKKEQPKEENVALEEPVVVEEPIEQNEEI